MPTGDFEIRQKNYFAALCERENELLHTDGCYEKYSAKKARELLDMLENYRQLSAKLSLKKQQQILSNLTLVALSFFI